MLQTQELRTNVQLPAWQATKHEKVTFSNFISTNSLHLNHLTELQVNDKGGGGGNQQLALYIMFWIVRTELLDKHAL